MTPKWLSLIALILGEAVVTTMDHALEALSAQPATPPQPAAQKASA